MKSHNLNVHSEGMIRTTIKIEKNFDLLVYKNISHTPIYLPKKKDNKKLIHFIVCSSGAFELRIGSEHNLTLAGDQFIIIYGAPSIVFVKENTQLFLLQINLKKFHQMIVNQNDLLDFLFSSDKMEKTIFKVAKTHFSHCSIVKQIIQSLHSKSELVYLKSKTYELLSILTHFLTKSSKTMCNYPLNQDAVKKIENAKNILDNNIDEPPLTSELSELVHLSLQKLSKGFKQVYGTSIQDYLINHKMIVSQELLISKKYTVKEIALRVGYSTSSHFIAAFKKKFGTTPKKYVMSLN